MTYQIEQWPSFTVAGYRKRIKTSTSFKEVPALWKKAQITGTVNALIKIYKEAGCRPPGLLGMAVGGQWKVEETVDYYMGVTVHVDTPGCKKAAAKKGMEEYTVPAATWAVVQCEGSLPDSIQNVYKEFYSQWLPSSVYGLANVPVIECYFPDRQEIWFGIVQDK